MSAPTASPVTRTAATVWVAFSALALGQLLVDIDDVVLNIALPSIAADVGLTVASVPWAVNAYLLTVGGLLLLGALLATALPREAGRRPVTEESESRHGTRTA